MGCGASASSQAATLQGAAGECEESNETKETNEAADIDVTVVGELSGDVVLECRVCTSSTVDELKRRLAKASGKPVAAQCLKMQGKEVMGAKTWQQLEASGSVRLTLLVTTPGDAPSYTSLEVQKFDGETRVELPEGGRSAGNAARSISVWLRNGRSGNADERLGWTVFGQGRFERGRMFTICARNDAHGMGIWGHFRDIWSGGGSAVWPAGKWHHLAVTWDECNLALYYDGEVVGIVGPWTAWNRESMTFDTDPSQAFFGGGAHDGPGGNPHMKYFKGEAAGLRVWGSTCISPESVRQWMELDRMHCST